MKGINLLLVILTLPFIQGCATEYNYITGKVDTIIYSPEREVELGLKIAKRFEEEFPVIKDANLQDKVTRLGNRIVKVCDRPDVPYSFKVADMPVPNALSLPGGRVYISKKLIELLDYDNKLIMAVLAHEVAHIVLKHHIKKLQASYVSSLAMMGAIASRDRKALSAVNLALNSLFSAYSQDDEFSADRLAIAYLQRAGLSGEEMAKSLEVLEKETRYDRITPVSYFRTHPFLSARIARARALAKDKPLSDFIDYINRG